MYGRLPPQMFAPRISGWVSAHGQRARLRFAHRRLVRRSLGEGGTKCYWAGPNPSVVGCRQFSTCHPPVSMYGGPPQMFAPSISGRVSVNAHPARSRSSVEAAVPAAMCDHGSPCKIEQKMPGFSQNVRSAHKLRSHFPGEVIDGTV
jgi:hypothetical protein